MQQSTNVPADVLRWVCNDQSDTGSSNSLHSSVFTKSKVQERGPIIRSLLQFRLPSCSFVSVMVAGFPLMCQSCFLFLGSEQADGYIVHCRQHIQGGWEHFYTFMVLCFNRWHRNITKHFTQQSQGSWLETQVTISSFISCYMLHLGGNVVYLLLSLFPRSAEPTEEGGQAELWEGARQKWWTDPT